MTEHETALEKVGTTLGLCVANILATFDRATPANVEAGANWYAEAEALVDQLVAASRCNREQVAAVIAQLSPRTTWSRNVAGATSLILTGIAPGCIGANVERALVAKSSTDPLATINGPKTSRFAANILGDREAVTVDVWAWRVAGGSWADDAELRKSGVYEAVEQAYKIAAAARGVSPATMQAVTWVVIRNGRAA